LKKKDNTPLLLKFVRWVFPKLELIAPSLAHRYFIRIFFTPLKYRVPEKEKEIRQRAHKFELRVDGKKIQCYEWGKGPVVLLVHGWAGRASQFRKIIEAFVIAEYKVVGFDGPAHGESEGKSTNIIEFEHVLRKIYEVTGVPEGIIAHSFGGGAVLYAAMLGLPVKKLINIASPTIGDEIIDTYLRTINGSWNTGNFFKGYMIKKFNKTFDEFTALYFITRIADLPEILLVHDEDDKEVYIKHAEALKKLYPGAILFRTKGLGHTRIMKDEAVINRCVTFIREIRLSH
jgi:pimeloyl-ACP methyl ester carboxylesterase